MNRIKEARERKLIRQQQLAKQLGVSQQAFNYYEKSKIIPDDDTWDKMEKILDVPAQYLKAETNDPEGWDLWFDATGYNKERIIAEINRLTKSHRILESDSLQTKIGKAVTFLDGRGGTDYNAVTTTRKSINELLDKIKSDYYIDPIKNTKAHPKDGKLSSMVQTEKDSNGSLFYDDMNKEVYFKISEILQKASNELATLANGISNKNNY